MSFGGRAAAVDDPVIEEIRSRTDSSGFVRLADHRGLKPGDAVRLMDGPLNELDGLLDTISDQHRAVLFVNFLGRQVRVTVSPELITPRT